MKLILIATSLMLCGLHTSEAVGPDELRAYFGQVDPEVWRILLKLGVSAEFAGRSGVRSDKDRTCKVNTTEVLGDFCFIVQTSCLESDERRSMVLESVKNDIGDILKNGDEPNFSLVTYSEDCNVALKWSDNATEVGEALDKIKSKPCDSCKSATYKALDKCEELFANQADGDKNPDNIVIFSNGISVEDICDIQNARRKTLEAAGEIKSGESIHIQVVKIPPTNAPAPIPGDKEWNSLSYTAKNTTGREVRVDSLGVDNNQTIGVFLRSDRQNLTEDCCSADVIFLLDKSDSIAGENIGRVVTMFKNFTEQVKERILKAGADPTTRGLRIAVYTYARQVDEHARLGQHGYEGLKNLDINSTTFTFTHTHDALDRAREEFMNNKRDVHKIVVLCTDGRTFVQQGNGKFKSVFTITAAKKLREMGVSVNVVGLPNKSAKKEKQDGYEREWKHVASGNVTCTITNLQRNGTWDQLDDVWKLLTEQICLNTYDDTSCRWKDRRYEIPEN